MSGRQLLLIVLVGLLLTVGLLFYFMGEAAWRLWNIPVMTPSFADTRSILSGIQAHRLGYDPLFQNPVDPFGRVMAYPRLWLLLGAFPLSPDHTSAAAAAEIVLFLIALFSFVERWDRRAVPWIAGMLISPAAMLCFERANTDLVAFFLIAVALALLPRLPVVSVLITELAALLKLYPAMALGFVLREPKERAVPWLSAALAVFVIYVAFTWGDVRQILAMASKGAGFNYGATVVGVWLLDLTGSAGLARFAVACAYLVVYLVLLVALYRSYRDGPAPAPSQASLDAFRVGACIYVGTFLQGNTWDYRFIFLIFAVPQLVEWLRLDDPHWRRTGLLALLLLLLSMWSPLFGASEPPAASLRGALQMLFDEILNWGLLALLSYLLIATLPDWIRQQIALFFEKYSRLVRAGTSA